MITDIAILLMAALEALTLCVMVVGAHRPALRSLDPQRILMWSTIGVITSLFSLSVGLWGTSLFLFVLSSSVGLAQTIRQADAYSTAEALRDEVLLIEDELKEVLDLITAEQAVVASLHEEVSEKPYINIPKREN